MTLLVIALSTPLVLYLIYLYFQHNDRCITRIPPRALKYSPQRVTAEEARKTFKRLQEHPHDIRTHLPPRTGRRYVVVGGAGFLGGWIVVQLLMRGEDPKKIRVLDIRKPTRRDLTTGSAVDVDFRVVDVSDANAVDEAFAAPWPDTTTDSDDHEAGISVFHVAANIRFYERPKWLVPFSAKVNVGGIQNVLNAARANGVSILVYTSSGSMCIRRSRFWLWPWETEPPFFFQIIDDDDAKLPQRHEHFFSNYAYTKRLGEILVREADKSPSGADGKGVLRTGCLRPGNAIIGPGGDILCGAYLTRKNNPSWIGPILQNFIYVENCSLAHLCYEARLLEKERGSANPDIGGQAFCVADPGPPLTHGDTHIALTALTDGQTTFPVLPPTLILAFAHVVEALYLSKQYLLLSPFPFSLLAKLVPPVGGDVINLQPALFALVNVHLVFLDHRARLPPSEGGLGYQGLWTTLEGLCKLVDEHNKSGGHVEERQRASGGIGFGFGLVKAERAVDRVVEELGVVDRLPKEGAGDALPN